MLGFRVEGGLENGLTVNRTTTKPTRVPAGIAILACSTRKYETTSLVPLFPVDTLVFLKVTAISAIFSFAEERKPENSKNNDQLGICCPEASNGAH